MKEIRAKARELLKGRCKVCPVCDGKACRGQVPGMGGLGTGSAFMANVEALAKVRFNMKVIHNVTQPETEIDFLGYKLDMPVLAAPIGGVSFNMTDQVTEDQYASDIVNGCKDAGVLAGCGDGAPPFVLDASLKAVKEAEGSGIPFIKPWESEELFEKLDKVKESGAKIVGMDLDAAGLITLRLMGKPVAPKTIAQLREIVEYTPLKFIVKGVLTPDDAERALEAGASGIVVSNHGGRVLDYAVSSAEVLPQICKKVKGKLFILADGGVRTGVDVLKLMALGADAVMIGRPFVWAGLGGGRKGVQKYLEQVKSELIQAMILTGTQDASKVSSDILYS